MGHFTVWGSLSFGEGLHMAICFPWLRRIGMLGKCDPYATYHRLVVETVQFLAERTAPAE